MAYSFILLFYLQSFLFGVTGIYSIEAPTNEATIETAHNSKEVITTATLKTPIIINAPF